MATIHSSNRGIAGGRRLVRVGLGDPRARRLYRLAFETAVWATPMLNSLHLRDELLKHGARPGDLAYVGTPPTGRLELLTFDTVAPTVFGGGSLKHGPVVIDVPPASATAKFSGTLMNVWDSPIEDIGPDGADGGQGGRFVLLPPDYLGGVPRGCTPLQCSSYEFHLWLRSVTTKDGDGSWADAVAYARRLKVYPLAEAVSPKPTGWFDVTSISGYFHGTPGFGFDSFRLIDDYVQNEPVQEFDKAMHGMLAEIGIAKGHRFAPDPAAAAVLDQAARDAGRFMRAELESGRVFAPYWPGRAWGTFKRDADIIRSLATWNLDDRFDYTSRAVNFFYFAAGTPRRFSGSSDLLIDLMATVDVDGLPLDGVRAYRLHVPADVPARDSWSITLYSTRTRSGLDTAKFGLSSRDALQVNRDGSLDLYLGPAAPWGKTQNWLATRADEHYFACARFYGPAEPLVNKTWKLGDFEIIA